MDLTALSRLVRMTPRPTLRWPSAEELVALGELAPAGIHPPEEMPFLQPWTDPSPTFVDDFIADHENLRRRWRPDDPNLELGVFVDDEPVTRWEGLKDCLPLFDVPSMHSSAVSRG